jgi:hypothetical protein
MTLLNGYAGGISYCAYFIHRAESECLMQSSLLFAMRIGLVAVLVAVGAARAESGACCQGEVCFEAADAQSCTTYVCDVAALLPASFGGCYGDVDGNGFVNAGDRGFISAAIGRTDNDAICRFDLDGSGQITAADRGFVSAAIGQCQPLPDFQNASGQHGGSADPRYPSPTFSPGLTCDEVQCGIHACAIPVWDDRFHVGGFNDEVSALAVFDDGFGSALYAGGRFATAGNARAAYIAKWNGTNWVPLVAEDGEVLDGGVNALAVFDDGAGPALYVGGWMSSGGPVNARGVVRWDGATWSRLIGPSGTGLNGEVKALAVFDDGDGPALYAGGTFSSAGSATANGIARWDGHTWSPLAGSGGIGAGASVLALAVYDDGSGPALYAAGGFTTAGGILANRVAKWDGEEWSTLAGPSGIGLDSTVAALAVFDAGSGAALYAAGGFTTAGGVNARRIAKWDGSTWSPVGNLNGEGAGAYVNALHVYDDGTGPALYAGGSFTEAGGIPARRIAKWDGLTWSGLSGPEAQGVDGTVRVIFGADVHENGALYVGGTFVIAGGIVTHRLAAWSNSSWSPVGELDGFGLSAHVEALAHFDDGAGEALYAAGWFRVAGDTAANYVAKWDGTAWSPLLGPSGNGTNLQISALAVFDDGTGPLLYAAGEFTMAGGISANYIAKWDGAGWSPLVGPSGTGIATMPGGSEVALAVFDDGLGPALYVGGRFLIAGGVTVNNIAKWNGSSWSALVGSSGTGIPGSYSSVTAMAVFDDGSGPALYVSGNFAAAGGIPASGMARWDGAEWSGLPGSPEHNPPARVLAVFDDGNGPALYAGGTFYDVGDVDARGIAKWDGAAWTAVRAQGDLPYNMIVRALTVLDDGTGPALFVGGWFSHAGTGPVGSLAKWDGVAWSPLGDSGGAGFNGKGVSVLAGFDDGSGPALYAGGVFSVAGGRPSMNIARWGCAP